MWFLLTAHNPQRSRKEKNKEFQSTQYQVILTADTREGIEEKLQETTTKFPQEIAKYLKAGIKIVEARNASEAKRKAHESPVYLADNGQYSLF
jgi:hypothetical protein